jgi:tetratricopeptide (TPR) repeat protein
MKPYYFNSLGPRPAVTANREIGSAASNAPVPHTWRKAYSLMIGAMICFATSCSSNSTAEDPVNDKQLAAGYVVQADQLYAQRDDLMSVRRGIVMLRQAVTADPGSYDAAWRLAKFNYYLATHTDDKQERDAAFRQGIEAGKTAVELQDGKPDGHFWLGANYGGSAQVSTLAGLAAVGDIKREMETVLRLDEGYQNGSAYMVLGILYLESPALLGGSPEMAVSELEKGVKIGDANAFLHLHLAEAYLKVGRKADARQQLQTIIDMKPDKDYLPEYKEAVNDARQLLPKT